MKMPRWWNGATQGAFLALYASKLLERENAFVSATLSTTLTGSGFPAERTENEERVVVSKITTTAVAAVAAVRTVYKSIHVGKRFRDFSGECSTKFLKFAESAVEPFTFCWHT
ncbi:hypothetical protein P5V15_010433 [Pogonomyrmex californicus]